jgi:hypothetical protein
MSIIVRIPIQDNERIRATINNQVVPILIACNRPTQETLVCPSGRGGCRMDVVRAPRSPNPIEHDPSLRNGSSGLPKLARSDLGRA